MKMGYQLLGPRPRVTWQAEQYENGAILFMEWQTHLSTQAGCKGRPHRAVAGTASQTRGLKRAEHTSHRMPPAASLLGGTVSRLAGNMHTEWQPHLRRRGELDEPVAG